MSGFSNGSKKASKSSCNASRHPKTSRHCHLLIGGTLGFPFFISSCPLSNPINGLESATLADAVDEEAPPANEELELPKGPRFILPDERLYAEAEAMIKRVRRSAFIVW